MARAPASTVTAIAPRQGRDGNTILYGSGMPPANRGRVGDFYIDGVAGRLYGPKSPYTWPDAGLIRGYQGWSPRFAAKTDGARRVLQVASWVGGEGTAPATGSYVGPNGLVSAIGDAVDVRGPQGPEMLISTLDTASGTSSYDTLVANAEPGGDNAKRSLQNLLAPGKYLPFATVAEAAALEVDPLIQYVLIFAAADDAGGPGHIRVRVDAEPAEGPKHRSADRYLSTGVTDSANGGWWALAFAPSIQSTDVRVPDEYAVARPAIQRWQETRWITDYIKRELWDSCRDGTIAENCVNEYGQDSLAAAVDAITRFGTVRVPEGLFPVLPYVLDREGIAICGDNRKSSMLRGASATAHHIDVAAPWCVIADLGFGTTATRTAGYCVNVRYTGHHIEIEKLYSDQAWGLLQIDGGATAFFNARYLLAENSRPNSVPYIVKGGYLVHLHELLLSSGAESTHVDWPLAGLRVKHTADTVLTGNCQLLTALYPLLIDPDAGQVVASFRQEGGFLGTSYYGSLATTENGGDIVSLSMKGVWAGESQYAGSPGSLTFTGTSAKPIKSVVLTDMEYPLSASDGLHVNPYVNGLQMKGGWADGCTGAGYAILTSGWMAEGLRSGPERFEGNAIGMYIGAAANNWQLSNSNLLGNASSNLANAAGTSSSKVITNVFY